LSEKKIHYSPQLKENWNVEKGVTSRNVDSGSKSNIFSDLSCAISHTTPCCGNSTVSGVRTPSSLAIELVIDNVLDGESIPWDGDTMAVDSAKGWITPDGISSPSSPFFQRDPPVALNDSEAPLRTFVTSFISGETEVVGRPIEPP
jgi:hypothetical protein